MRAVLVVLCAMGAFVQELYDRSCQEIGGVGKEYGQNEKNTNVTDRSPYADLGDRGKAQLLYKWNITPVKVIYEKSMLLLRIVSFLHGEKKRPPWRSFFEGL